jgi:hypothetical protein
LTGAADVHVLVAAFFLAVLAAAVIGLWRTVREDLPLILSALGPSAPKSTSYGFYLTVAA